MQFKSVALVASAIMFAACGGSETTPATDAAAPAAAEAAPAAGTATMAPATGTVHEIKMVGDDKGYRFEPANLTIKSGDAIKFIGVSGFPHNVAFVGTSLAPAVKSQLDANFGTARMGELMSTMFVAPNEGFTLSFANIPAGSYEYNCTPHLAMNMKGVITVQ
jgi:plastocyanin